jgi:hypothetical protein
LGPQIHRFLINLLPNPWKAISYQLIIKANPMFRLMVALALITMAVMNVALPVPVLAAIYTLEPIADGSHINLSVSGGGPNWAAASASDGSPYVYNGTSGWQVDDYDLPNVTLAGIINSVTVWIRARDGSAPTQTGAWPALRIGGVLYPGTAVILTNAWADYSSTYTTSPATGTSWTWGEVNNLEAGVRLRRSASGVQSDCDHVWVVLDYTPPPARVPVFNGWWLLMGIIPGLFLILRKFRHSRKSDL